MADETTAALQAARQAFSKRMAQEPFPMECAVTNDWPIEPAIKAYLAALPVNTSHDEAINLLLKWCGLFFGRNADGHHIDNEAYRKAHTQLFMETADWLKAKGYRK